MKTNLWCQINDFLFIWKGNWEQINDLGWGGGVGEGGEKRCLSTISIAIFVAINKRNRGQINNFFLFFGVYQYKKFSVYKHLIFVVYKQQYYCVYKRSIMGSF